MYAGVAGGLWLHVGRTAAGTLKQDDESEQASEAAVFDPLNESIVPCLILVCNMYYCILYSQRFCDVKQYRPSNLSV
jgi:hypothetical protein